MSMNLTWGALFDLDGTLMDSERHSHSVITRALAARGLPDPGLPDHKVFGCRWLEIARDAVEALAAARGVPPHAVASPAEVITLADAMSEIYVEVVFSEVIAVPGAPQAVRAAAQALGGVALVTSSDRAYADRALIALGLAEVIPVARRVCAEDVSQGKPHPEPYLTGAARLGLPAARCVVFEDSAAGLRAGLAAGCPRVAVLHSVPDAAPLQPLCDAEITDWSDLQTPESWVALLRWGAERWGR